MKPARQIGLIELISIAIGGMVGGGIFSTIGIAALHARGATPIALGLGGLVALITSYTYIHISKVAQGTGGTAEYLNQAFGTRILTGGLTMLLWVCYLIMIALSASAFGNYAPNLMSVFGNHVLDFHFYATLVILLAAFINYQSVALIGKTEKFASLVKLSILFCFIVLGLLALKSTGHISQIEPSNWNDPLAIFVGGMVVFLTYEGFELIANAAPTVKNRDKNIPRAFVIAICSVMLIYILISVVVIGTLSFSEIEASPKSLLADAARPGLGQPGFIVMSIAALVSTFSAVTATLFGCVQVNKQLSKDRQFPSVAQRKVGKATTSLFISTGLALAAVNLLNLETIVTAGSLGFLLVFAFLNASGLVLRKRIACKPYLPALGSLLCLIAFVITLKGQFSNHFESALVALGTIVVCFIAATILYKQAEQADRIQAREKARKERALKKQAQRDNFKQSDTLGSHAFHASEDKSHGHHR